MNPEALPYTLLLMLAEIAVGGLAVVTVFDARRMVTRGYVQTGALVVLPLAAMATAVIFTVGAADEVDGYLLEQSWTGAVRLTLGVFTAACALYLLATLAGPPRAAVIAGVAGSIAGVVALIAIAGLVAPPTWSFAGSVASVLAGAAVLGAALMAMNWGHWYLTNSGLPKEPLEQMSLVVLGAVVVNAVLVLLGAVLPARAAPVQESLGVGLAANPAFWLRVLIGLVFPVVLATLAWRAAAMRGMMSATGLLYIALGAVLAGELIARGLLFATGALV